MAKRRLEAEQEAPAEDQLMDELQEDTTNDTGMDADDAGVGGTEAADTSSVDEEPEESVPAWKRALVEAGFNEFEDPDSAVTNTVSAIKQRDQQIQELARQVQWYQDQQKYSQPPQSQGQEADIASKPSDPIDELLDGWEDPRWAEQYIEVDEDGFRRLKDGVDEFTAEKVKALDRKMQKWGEILQDPRKFVDVLDKRMERAFSERFDQTYEQRQRQQTEQQVIDGFINENASWMYERDPATGQYLRDPLTQQLRFTNEGAEFIQHMQVAKDDGIQSIAKQLHYAQLAMGQRAQSQAQVQQQRQESAAQIADQKRREMLGKKRSGQTTQRSFNGVSPESASQPAGSSLSFGEETLALMKTGG